MNSCICCNASTNMSGSTLNASATVDPVYLLGCRRLLALEVNSGDTDSLGQNRQSLLHLAGPAMPQVPRLAIGAACSTLPIGKQFADLTVKFIEPGAKIRRRACYGLCNPVHYLGVDAHHITLSHSA